MAAIKVANTVRNKDAIEALWSCGLRRIELPILNVEDVNFAEGFLIVQASKTGRPRVAPPSPAARHALRKYLGSGHRVLCLV